MLQRTRRFLADFGGFGATVALLALLVLATAVIPGLGR
jgi:hypothetical protein